MTITLTDGESKIMLSIMQNLTSDITFDADKVATELGYKDGNIVKTRWGQIKRKHFKDVPSGSAKKRTPVKAAAKRKTSDAAAADSGDGDDEETIETPVKPAAKCGKKNKVNKEVVEQEEDEGGVSVGEDLSMAATRASIKAWMDGTEKSDDHYSPS